MVRILRPLILVLVLTISLAGMMARAAGNEVVGTYRVEHLTDLGGEVRVTLQIHLVNNTAQDLTVTQVSLRGMRQPGKPEAVAAGAHLQPREGTTVEHEFLVSRAEYESWSKGGSPALQVEYQAAGGRDMVRTIRLSPLPAGRRP